MMTDAPREPLDPTPRRDILAWTERPWLVILVLAVLTIAMTWPLPARLATHVPLGAFDLWQNYWDFWWWEEALVERGVSPYTCSVLYFPDGMRMAIHTHSEANQILFLPVTMLAGPGAAYGAAILFSYLLAGIGAYALARYLTASGPAAFLAALIFAFFPHHTEQTLEHLNLSSIGFLPLFLLFLLRIFREGRARDGILAGTFFALNYLSCQHYAIMACLLAGPIAVAETMRAARAPEGRAARIRRAAVASVLAVAVAIAISAPALIGVIRDQAAGLGGAKPQEDRGIDPAFLLLPHPDNPLLGGIGAKAYDRARYAAVGFTCYLGWVPVLLALAALRSRRNLIRTSRWAWFAILVASLILAIGPHLRIAGRLYDGEAPPGGGPPLPVIRLPHYLFRHIPMLELLRVPNRFAVPATLALAVLAAGGAASLVRRHRICAAIAPLIVLLEYAWLPYPLQEDPTRDVALRQALALIRDDPVPGGVLDIPPPAEGAPPGGLRIPAAARILAQVRQTVHGKPIAGGYTSLPWTAGIAKLREDPFIAEVLDKGPRDPTLRNPPDVGRLRALGFRWIILPMDRTREALAAARAEAQARGVPRLRMRDLAPWFAPSRGFLEAIDIALRSQIGAPVWADGRIRIWRLSDAR
ncbi:MAG: hypothetical protein JXP34_23970 [Planctomycetes bacterium]|nr:hypothetical protein [Planctomycetota bacterium]